MFEIRINVASFQLGVVVLSEQVVDVNTDRDHTRDYQTMRRPSQREQISGLQGKANRRKAFESQIHQNPSLEL